jgi:hypothetical protein
VEAQFAELRASVSTGYRAAGLISSRQRKE